MPTDSHSIVIDYHALNRMKIWGLVQQLTFILERGNRLFLLPYRDCMIQQRYIQDMEECTSMERSFCTRSIVP